MSAWGQQKPLAGYLLTKSLDSYGIVVVFVCNIVKPPSIVEPWIALNTVVFIRHYHNWNEDGKDSWCDVANLIIRPWLDVWGYDLI